MPPDDELSAAFHADPFTRRWGLYLAPASGEGDGLLWFDSVPALQAFLVRDLWQALKGVAPAEGTILALAAVFEGEPGLSWERLDRLNQELEPVAQVHWWGSLRQLYEGEDPFAKDLREAWRQSVGRGPQDFSSLPEADARAFCDFLRTIFNPEP